MFRARVAICLTFTGSHGDQSGVSPMSGGQLTERQCWRRADVGGAALQSLAIPWPLASTTGEAQQLRRAWMGDEMQAGGGSEWQRGGPGSSSSLPSAAGGREGQARIGGHGLNHCPAPRRAQKMTEHCHVPPPRWPFGQAQWACSLSPSCVVSLSFSGQVRSGCEGRGQLVVGSVSWLNCRKM